MLRGEFRWWDSPDAAVGPGFVVVTSPACDFDSRICEAREPVLVETLISEAGVEALNVGVLWRAARLNQYMFDLIALRPSQKGTRGELGAVVGSDGLRIAAKLRRLVK